MTLTRKPATSSRTLTCVAKCTPPRLVWGAVYACTLGLLAAPASAQIVYSPAASSVPTLGTYALLILSVLMVVIALRAGFIRGNRVNTAALLCLSGAIASGFSGVKLLEQAHADGGDSGGVLGFLDSPTGGSVPITSGALNFFENSSGTRVRLDSIGLPLGCSNPNSGSIDGAGQCTVGQTVSTGSNGICYTDCRSEPD